MKPANASNTSRTARETILVVLSSALHLIAPQRGKIALNRT
jgi:hypothetical protein